jgi:RNA polymerase sigma-70 factor (ECF subfamily)
MKTDAQLIRDATADPDALAELYARHARTVYAVVRRRAGDAVAADLTAETFAQAALSLRRFRDEAGGSAVPWLLGIAANLTRSYHERQRVETRARARLGMPVGSYELDADDAAERLDAERLAPALAAALESLPDGQREALERRVIDGLSYDELATSLGCSEVAARLRVLRARGSLRRTLKGASP